MSGVENAFFARLARDLSKVEAPMTCSPLEHNALLCCAEAALPHSYVTYPGTLIGRQNNLNTVWIVYPTPIGICCTHVRSSFPSLQQSSSGILFLKYLAFIHTTGQTTVYLLRCFFFTFGRDSSKK